MSENLGVSEGSSLYKQVRDCRREARSGASPGLLAGSVPSGLGFGRKLVSGSKFRQATDVEGLAPLWPRALGILETGFLAKSRAGTNDGRPSGISHASGLALTRLGVGRTPVPPAHHVPPLPFPFDGASASSVARRASWGKNIGSVLLDRQTRSTAASANAGYRCAVLRNRYG